MKQTLESSLLSPDSYNAKNANTGITRTIYFVTYWNYKKPITESTRRV